MLLHVRGLSCCYVKRPRLGLNLTSPMGRARSLAIAQRRITSLTTNDTLLPLNDRETLVNHARDLQNVVQTGGKHVLLPVNDKSANGRLRGDLIECLASNGFVRLSDSKPLHLFFLCLSSFLNPSEYFATNPSGRC
jgi:hypothetical protein